MRTPYRCAVSMLIAVSAASCASGGGGRSGAGENAETFVVRFRQELRSFDETFRASPEVVFAAVPGVFQRFGYPGGKLGGAQKTYATTQFDVRGRLYSDEPNSNYFDCGLTPANAPAANEYAINFVIITRVIPVGTDSSRVEVAIDGTANSKSMSSTKVACSGTGKLERAVLQALRERIS